MKKIEYIAPEMEVIKIKVSAPLLQASGEAPGDGGNGDDIDE